MPKSDLHKRKFKKNIAVLAMILGFFALVWAITMIKIATNKQISSQESVHEHNGETPLPVTTDTVEYP